MLNFLSCFIIKEFFALNSLHSHFIMTEQHIRHYRIKRYYLKLFEFISN